MRHTSRQPWIYSKWINGIFILSPPFLCLVLILLFPAYFGNASEISVVWWIILVVLIDVAHVYSTLYRTYFDAQTYRLQKSIFIYIPFSAWVGGVILYLFDGMMFWRVLAYLAVFHFIRQQYGFLRIYSRTEVAGKWFRLIDQIAIYSATIYPIVFWHLTPDRAFNWFIKGEFIQYDSPFLLQLSSVVYFLIVLAYLGKEIAFILQSNTFNIPRNLIVSGTFLSWYFGIVYYNGDLIYTLLNVVSHGVPYMALVWIYGRKKYYSNKEPKLKFLRLIFSNAGILLFILIIAGLAFFEEGIWDAAVWNEHKSIFSFFSFIPKVSDRYLLSFIIPLLALPQITHYVLDGFIWKINKDKFNWKENTLSS